MSTQEAESQGQESPNNHEQIVQELIGGPRYELAVAAINLMTEKIREGLLTMKKQKIETLLQDQEDKLKQATTAMEAASTKFKNAQLTEEEIGAIEQSVIKNETLKETIE